MRRLMVNVYDKSQKVWPHGSNRGASSQRFVRIGQVLVGAVSMKTVIPTKSILPADSPMASNIPSNLPAIKLSNITYLIPHTYPHPHPPPQLNSTLSNLIQPYPTLTKPTKPSRSIQHTSPISILQSIIYNLSSTIYNPSPIPPGTTQHNPSFLLSPPIPLSPYGVSYPPIPPIPHPPSPISPLSFAPFPHPPSSISHPIHTPPHQLIPTTTTQPPNALDHPIPSHPIPFPSLRTACSSTTHPSSNPIPLLHTTDSPDDHVPMV